MPARRLAALIAELASGGILIVDPFPDRSEDQVAFRTLVQLDGDVTLAIHAEVVGRPDFTELFDAHTQHVRAVLERKGAAMRRLANAMVGFGVVFGALGGGGAGFQIGDFTLVIMQIPATVMPFAVGSIGALLFWVLASVGLRVVLRRLAFRRSGL